MPSAYLPKASQSSTVTEYEAGSSASPQAVVAAPPGTRAVIYLRVSSTGQVNTDYDPEGISIPAQRVACVRKVDQLGLNIVGEYVEPGRSATEITKRVSFQQMLARIRKDKDVDFVVVYKLSRFARNRIDDAVVMADLQKRGVTLISATEQIDDTPVGQLMHGILAAFNEYRSREDGADIAYKMGEKAKKGGTIGKAPIGYLNTIDRREGREIRSIEIDPERAPLVKLAFQLYADGNVTIQDIADELTTRGLTTRPTRSRPAGPISHTKVAAMLRDRYYLGRVKYKGDEFAGRHEPLISQELFDRVQQLMEERGFAGERRRKLHHYLKGSLFCGKCHEKGFERRIIMQRATGRHGGLYHYFFCRGTQDHTCDAPYNNVELVEAAIEEHYKTIHFSQDFIDGLRGVMEELLADTTAASRLQRKQLTTQLKSLDVKEENLLDLAADGTMATAKVQRRLREIAEQRQRITAQLDEVLDDLGQGAKYIDLCLELLANPYKLYIGASDETRRRLNQAIFTHLYIYDEAVTDHEITSPLAELLAADTGTQVARAKHNLEDGKNAAYAAYSAHTSQHKGTTLPGGAKLLIDDLIESVHSRTDSSKASMVREGGLEPPRPKTLEPKSSASANSATRACAVNSTGRAAIDPGQVPSKVCLLRVVVPVGTARHCWCWWRSRPLSVSAWRGGSGIVSSRRAAPVRTWATRSSGRRSPSRSSGRTAGSSCSKRIRRRSRSSSPRA